MQDHLDQMNRLRCFLWRNLNARSPKATIGEPTRPSTGKLVARFDETNKETRSFTILNPRFAGNVPTVNLPSSADEAYPPNFMIGQPNQKISDLHFENFFSPEMASVGRRVSKQKCVLVPITLRTRCVGCKKSRSLLVWTILRRRGRLLEIYSETSRRLKRKKCWTADTLCRLDSHVTPQYDSEHNLGSLEALIPRDEESSGRQTVPAEIPVAGVCCDTIQTKGTVTTGQACCGIFCADQTGFADEDLGGRVLDPAYSRARCSPSVQYVPPPLGLQSRHNATATWVSVLQKH